MSNIVSELIESGEIQVRGYPFIRSQVVNIQTDITTTYTGPGFCSLTFLNNRSYVVTVKVDGSDIIFAYPSSNTSTGGVLFFKNSLELGGYIRGMIYYY